MQYIVQVVQIILSINQFLKIFLLPKKVKWTDYCGFCRSFCLLRFDLSKDAGDKDRFDLSKDAGDKDRFDLSKDTGDKDKFSSSKDSEDRNFIQGYWR